MLAVMFGILLSATGIGLVVSFFLTFVFSELGSKDVPHSIEYFLSQNAGKLSASEEANWQDLSHKIQHLASTDLDIRAGRRRCIAGLVLLGGSLIYWVVLFLN